MSLILRCPTCKSSVVVIGSDYVCSGCRAVYEIDDKIPRFEKHSIKGTKKEEVSKFWNTAPNESLSSGAQKNSGEFFRETEFKRYHQLHKDMDKPFLKEAIRFENYRHKKILEVGCGIGIDSIQFARAGNDLTLVDLTINSIKIARERLRHEGYDANFIVADSENLPFADNQFDVVYSYGVIHHSPNTSVSVEEIYRVLKPGGEAIVMLYNYYSAMVFCYVFIGEGLRRGYYFKYRSLQELLNRRTELQSATTENEPVLTQAFSKREVKLMFSMFKNTAIETHYLTKGMFAQFRYLLKVIPISVKRKLARIIGWNHIIRAVK